MKLSREARPAVVFWLVVGIHVAYANAVFAMLLEAPVPTADSYGYLIWSLVRTIGYPALLSAYDAIFPTWTALPAVQLNLLLGGVVAVAWGVARLTHSYVAGAIVLLLTAAAANMLLSAAYIMTEAPFSAALMLHVGAMFALLYRPSRTPAILAGLALAAAVLVKSVATALVGPLLLFLAFAAPPMRRLLALVLVPALLAWAGPSLYNLARFGVFETSIIGGYALAGHVAWAIRARPPSPHEEIAARIEARLAPELAKRPAWQGNRETYTTYTSNEYNTLLWGNIVPVVSEYVGPKHCTGDHFLTCKWSGCPAQCMIHANRIMVGLSREAIAAQPRDYAYHVFAHALALWTGVFRSSPDFVRGVNARAEELPYAYSPDTTIARPLLEPVPDFATPQSRAERVAAIEGSWATKLAEAITLRTPATYALRWLDRAGMVMPWIGLAASALVVFLRRLPAPAAAFSYTGLVLNAYLVGTSLAQPMLVRYSWPMQGLLSAMLVLGVWLVARESLRKLRTAV